MITELSRSPEGATRTKRIAPSGLLSSFDRQTDSHQGLRSLRELHPWLFPVAPSGPHHTAVSRVHPSASASVRALLSRLSSNQATSPLSANRFTPTLMMASSGTTFSGVYRGWWLSLYGSLVFAL